MERISDKNSMLEKFYSQHAQLKVKETEIIKPTQ